jgi:transcriptional regulator with XRE-family HTH domain
MTALHLEVARVYLARRLRAARIAAGLTQAQVAAEMSLHRPAISMIESGRRLVEACELAHLASLYGVTVASLLDEEAAA